MRLTGPGTGKGLDMNNWQINFSLSGFNIFFNLYLSFSSSSFINYVYVPNPASFTSFFHLLHIFLSLTLFSTYTSRSIPINQSISQSIKPSPLDFLSYSIISFMCIFILPFNSFMLEPQHTLLLPINLISLNPEPNVIFTHPFPRFELGQ